MYVGNEQQPHDGLDSENESDTMSDTGSFSDDSDAETVTFSDIEEYEQQLRNDLPGYGTDDAPTETEADSESETDSDFSVNWWYVFVWMLVLKQCVPIFVWDNYTFSCTYTTASCCNIDTFIMVMHLLNWLRKLWSIVQEMKGRQTENENIYAHIQFFTITLYTGCKVCRVYAEFTVCNHAIS